MACLRCGQQECRQTYGGCSSKLQRHSSPHLRMPSTRKASSTCVKTGSTLSVSSDQSSGGALGELDVRLVEHDEQRQAQQAQQVRLRHQRTVRVVGRGQEEQLWAVRRHGRLNRCAHEQGGVMNVGPSAARAPACNSPRKLTHAGAHACVPLPPNLGSALKVPGMQVGVGALLGSRVQRQHLAHPR